MAKEGKIIKRVIRQRDKEYAPPYDPTTPFSRKITRTRLPWYIELIEKKRWDVIIILLVIIIAMLAVGAVLLYYVLHWLMWFAEVLFI